MFLREKFLASRQRFLRQRVALAPGLAALVDGDDVWIREMSALDSGTFEDGRWRQVDEDDKVRRVLDMSSDRQRLLVRCLCDADGERIFADDDALAVGQIPRQLADAIYDAASKLNGLGKYAKDADEDLEKNSIATPAISATS